MQNAENATRRFSMKSNSSFWLVPRSQIYVCFRFNKEMKEELTHRPLTDRHVSKAKKSTRVYLL